jgi:transcription elongation factor Elf1
MKAATKTRTYISCPVCGKGESRVCHLSLGQSFGPWSCDVCGHFYRGTRTEQGADIEVIEGQIKKKRIDVLEFIHDARLKIYVESFDVTNPNISEAMEERNSIAYFYEEHDCPSNYLRCTEDVIFDNEKDPHGIFRYVETIRE